MHSRKIETMKGIEIRALRGNEMRSANDGGEEHGEGAAQRSRRAKQRAKGAVLQHKHEVLVRKMMQGRVTGDARERPRPHPQVRTQSAPDSRYPKMDVSNIYSENGRRQEQGEGGVVNRKQAETRPRVRPTHHRSSNRHASHSS